MRQKLHAGFQGSAWDASEVRRSIQTTDVNRKTNKKKHFGKKAKMYKWIKKKKKKKMYD